MTGAATAACPPITSSRQKLDKFPFTPVSHRGVENPYTPYAQVKHRVWSHLVSLSTELEKKIICFKVSVVIFDLLWTWIHQRTDSSARELKVDFLSLRLRSLSNLQSILFYFHLCWKILIPQRICFFFTSAKCFAWTVKNKNIWNKPELQNLSLTAVD